MAIRVAAGLSVATIFSWLFARLLSDLANDRALVRADLRVSALVQSLRTEGFTKVMVFATDLGRWQGIAAGAVALVLGLSLWKRRADILALLLTLGFGELAIWLIKTRVHRARPEPGNALTFESSFSFPSGHTFVSTVFYGLATYVLLRGARGGLKALIAVSGLALVLAVGLSRVYLGVHWPSDVLASFAAGAIWLALAITPLTILGRNPSGRTAWLTPEKRAAVVAALGVLWIAAVAILYAEVPLRQPHVVPLVVPVIAETEVPARLFASLPKTSEDISGRPMEPVNVVIVGFEEQVKAVFARAGWIAADPLSLHALRREVAAFTKKTPYPEQPGTPTFWNGRPNLLTFEKPTPANTISERHHIHLWNSGINSTSARSIWVATAHFDKGFERTSMPVPVHAIDPDIDQQREFVRRDLEATGAVASVARLPVTGRVTGRNYAGDRFYTDGSACLLVLK